VHRVENYVADELGGKLFAARIVPTVHEAGSAGFAAGLEDSNSTASRRASLSDPPFA
jgi:hypothetical protein